MNVIDFEHVSKGYRLGATNTSLRHAIAHWGRQLVSGKQEDEQEQLFWALRDVTFHVQQADVLGIIGRNGAGKSTMLKLLSRVAYPTEGNIRIRGRSAALIELGAGFHPELTGRENVYLNGTILGLKRQEINEQFDKIVDYAGLEQFIDTPVKRYSSGMYVRLAFSIAAHVRADLLIIDEVLSVGDAAFQQKSFATMQELRNNGTTIVLVSHNMWNIEHFCKRVILLNAGKVVEEGEPGTVVERHLRMQRQSIIEHSGHSTGTGFSQNGATPPDETLITHVEVLDVNGEPVHNFFSNDTMVVRIHYYTPSPLVDAQFGIMVVRTDGVSCFQVYQPAERANEHIGKGMVEARVGPLQLSPDVYMLEVGIYHREQPLVIAHWGPTTIQIEGKMSEIRQGLFTPNVNWDTPVPIK